MYDIVKKIFLEGKIDLGGLDRALKFKWIAEEQKLEITELKRLQDQQ